MIPPDANELCRLCLHKEGPTFSIFNGEGQFDMKIKACLPLLMIQVDDPLPKVLCRECVQKLDSLYDFQLATYRVQKQMLGWFNDMKQVERKIEIIEENIEQKTTIKEEAEECSNDDGNTIISLNATDEEVKYSVANDASILALDPLAIRPSTPEKLVEHKISTIIKSQNQLKSKKKSNQLLTRRISSQKTALSNKIKTFICTVCDKRFMKASILKRHILTHTGEKPFSCTVCNKKFYQSSHLGEHSRIHTEEKPYVCNVCDKKFSRGSHLKEHIKMHDTEKAYRCLMCDKRFTYESSWKRHVRIHTGDKLLSCSVCEKKFTVGSHLRSHFMTHTGERPAKKLTQYSCSVCNKKFSRRWSLSEHSKTHTGEKPYACSVCNKRFNRASNLQSHSLTHSGEKPYLCAGCGKKFACLSNLTRHSRTHNYTGESGG